jgi:hypothetical protein
MSPVVFSGWLVRFFESAYEPEKEKVRTKRRSTLSCRLWYSLWKKLPSTRDWALTDGDRIERAAQPWEGRDRRAAEPARRLGWRLRLSERAERILDPSLTQLRGPAPGRFGRVCGLTVDLLIEDAVAAANHRGRVTADVPGHAEARREVVQIALRESRWQVGIAREQNAARRVWHHRRLNTRHPGGMPAALLVERNERLVAKAVVDGERRMELPGVRHECLVLHGKWTVVGNPELHRGVVERSDHEIRNRIPRSRAGEAARTGEREIELEDRPDELVSPLERVVADVVGHRVLELPALIVLRVHARVAQIDGPRYRIAHTPAVVADVDVDALVARRNLRQRATAGPRDEIRERGLVDEPGIEDVRVAQPELIHIAEYALLYLVQVARPGRTVSNPDNSTRI